MANLRLSIPFKAFTGFMQQLWGHAEVVLSRREIFMPQIRRQLGQKSLHVGAGLVPRDEPVHDSRVSDIVETRRITGTALTLDIRLPSDPLKERNGILVHQRIARAGGKERRGIAVRQGELAAFAG